MPSSPLGSPSSFGSLAAARLRLRITTSDIIDMVMGASPIAWQFSRWSPPWSLSLPIAFSTVLRPLWYAVCHAGVP